MKEKQLITGMGDAHCGQDEGGNEKDGEGDYLYVVVAFHNAWASWVACDSSGVKYGGYNDYKVACTLGGGYIACTPYGWDHMESCILVGESHVECKVGGCMHSPVFGNLALNYVALYQKEKQGKYL
jgi:hypothetical protein